MYSRTQLLTGKLPPLTDPLFESFYQDVIHGNKIYQGVNHREQFIHLAQEYFLSSKINTLFGLDTMGSTDIILGCHHFIDNLIMKHGIRGLQLLEHDYKYYPRLDPDITYSQIGALVPGKPLLIAAPFPGALDLHWQWSTLLNECDQKFIPVHLDGAWLGSAKNIHLDLTRPCIQSIGISLSKGLGLDWNRIGVRWSKTRDETDSVTIMNNFNMIPKLLMATGIAALETIPVDYLWSKYSDQYRDICQKLHLRPTNIIHAALSVDRKNLYGLRDCFISNSSL
jgi:hypothetical protein